MRMAGSQGGGEHGAEPTHTVKDTMNRHVWTAPSRQEHFWYFGK
jgi:hypothetical protein